MPPKPVKSRTLSAKPSGDQGLASVLFGEEGIWKASLAFVVGNRIEDYAHIETLVAAVKGGTRKLFSSLSREDLFIQVLELGNSKTPRKGKEVPQFSEICEPCKQHLDNGEEISIPLLAKLIKFKLLDIKSQDIKRRETEQRTLEERDKSSKGKSDNKSRSKSPAKGTKSAAGKGKAPEPTIAKAESKLRKRGEEDLDAKYINDEPDDGPKHYIIITGFHHPHLMSQLSEIGINMDVIININSQTYDASASTAAEDVKTTTPKNATAAAAGAAVVVEEEEKKMKERERTMTDLKKFWRDVLLLMQKAPASSALHDVARLEYTVPDSIVPSTAEDADAKIAFGATVFEVVACMMYNLLDAKRQWKNYLANLQLLHVPAVSGVVEPVEGPGVSKSPMLSHSQLKLESAMETEAKPGVCSVETDMRRYNDLMNSIPLESVSVPLVMHCMLEQVCAYENQAQPDAMQTEKLEYLDDGLAQHLNTLAFKLSLTVEERKMLFPDYMPSPSTVADGNQKQPMLISFHDDLTRRLNHLKPIDGFSPIEAELTMLGYSPASSILSRFPDDPDQRTAMERAARFQELLFFCTQQEAVSRSGISRALQQFVLECMNFTTVDEHGRICRPQAKQNDIPWDDPYPYYMGMIPDERVKSGSGERRDSSPKGSEANKEAENDPERLSRSGSILRRPESLGSRKRASSSHSVHFEEDDDGQPVPHPGDNDLDEFKDCPQSSSDTHLENSSSAHSSSLVDLSDVVNNGTKRNFDQWQYAEHMEPSVLLQALLHGLETHPYVDTYYQRRDNSFLIVLHNPYDPSISHSFDDWNVALHSNIRFRNYLEYVAGGIVEWTQTEEAKYEASLLAAEVARLQKDSEELPATPTDKRSRSKSPKKAESRNAKSSPASSVERSTPCESFVRAGSLKAWKEEQARIKAEEEEHARLAEEKRAKSAQKRTGKEPRTEDKKPKEKEKEAKKQPDPKSPTVNGAVEQTNAPAAVSNKPDRYWPFTGYDVGDKLIHIAGINSTLFPDDGGQIVTERIQYLHGSTSVRASVRKGGHSFTVHVIDPKQMNYEEEGHEAGKEDVGQCTTESATVAGEVQDGRNSTDPCLVSCDAEVKITEDIGNRQKDCNSAVPEAAGTEQGCELSSVGETPAEKSCVGRFGSFTAQFNDGMTLSVSIFGPSGEPPNGKPYEPEPYTVPVQNIVVTGSTTERDVSPAKRGKAGDRANKDKEKEKLPAIEVAAAPSEAELKEEVVKETPVVKPFQQLYVTCPDGLNVTYSIENSLEERRLLVRQCYPVKTKCQQNCDAARKTAMREQSRVITSDGTVIKTMTDGTTKVLFADGTVSEFCFSSSLLPAALTVVPDPQQVIKEVNTSASKKKGNRLGAKADQLGAATPAEEEKGYWITTLPTGERIANRLNGASVEVPNAVLCVASDPQTLQVMHTREDHVITIHHPDGLVIVEHSDGTRITTKQQIKEAQEEDAKEENEQRQLRGEDRVTADVQEYDNQRYKEDGEERSDEERELNVFYTSVAEEKITEVDERETDKTSVVKFVLVECPGYASVKFDSASGLCSTEFGSGCMVDCMLEGRYDIFHPTGGFLRLDPDGTAVYFDQRDGQQSPRVSRQPQYYVMRHFDSVIAETIDKHGTHYVVTNSGENHVNLLSDVGELRAEDGVSCEGMGNVRQPSADACNRLGRRTPQMRDTEESHGNHVPRMFVVRCDGSGQELLRSNDVTSYLSTVERDPSTVVLKAPLPNCTDIHGITVLRPLSKNTSQTWLKGYLLDSIIPAGLKSHDLRRSSIGEAKTQSSRFNKSSTPGVCGPLAKSEPVVPVATQVTCPSILEFRQIVKYNSVSEAQRNKLNLGLKAFADHVKKRATYYQEMSIQDTRTDEERATADELQAQLPTPCATPKEVKFVVDDVKSVYEKALTPVERPRITSSAKMRMKKYDLEKVKQELAEEQECRNTLRLRNISPYFKSELSAGYCNKQDKSGLTKQFLGYISCGSAVQSETVEQCNESPLLPPPGIACQHMSPEPEDRCADVKTTDRKSKTPEGSNPSSREKVNDDNEAVEKEPGPTDGDFAATDYYGTNAFIVSETSLADKETSPRTGNQFEDGKSTDQPMKPMETAQKLGDDALPAFRMPDFKGLLADLMTGNNAEVIEKTMAKDEKTSTEKADKALRQDSTRNGPSAKCDKGLQDFQKDPCAAANDNDECEKLIQKLATLSKPVSNCDEDDPVVVALTTQTAWQQNEGVRQPDCSDTNVTMERDYDSIQQVTSTTETSHLDNSICQANHPSVPGYLPYGKRPGATPNVKFARVEEPARRKVNNVIITGATPVGCQTINRMRGLELAPERADFGVLKEGNTYTLNLSLRNTGVDACRFRVKQPPPSTGVKILYKPGPVAAGMKTDIQVEIYAIAAGVEGDRGVGLIAHNVEITTETDQMLLPLTATVLTGNEFDSRGPDSPRGGKSPGVKLVSSKPPAGVGLIRPRKHLLLGESVVVN